jgi:predicted O-linked N-acetylglucosamine transferase (SPINDLY family)
MEAAWELHAAFRKHREDQVRLLAAAQALADEGRPDAAADAYRDALVKFPRSTDAWHGLAAAQLAGGRPIEARQTALEAIGIDPEDARLHGLIARTALAVDSPLDVEAYLRRSGLPDAASLSDSERLCGDPGRDVAALVRLASLQLAQGEAGRALRTLDIAARVAPGHARVRENMSVAAMAAGDNGRALLSRAQASAARGEHADAAEQFQQAIVGLASRPEGAATHLEEAYAGLGDALLAGARQADAALAYEEGIRACPTSAWLYERAASVYHDLGRADEARALARRGVEACPDSTALRRAAALTLPVIYRSVAEKVESRQAFARGLRRFAEEIRLDTPHERVRALEAVGADTNFDLAYQCEDDRELQEAYGSIVARVMSASYPQWAAPRRMPPPDATGRLRIGYVSAFLRHHAVANSHGGWIRHADRSRFAVHAYHLGRIADTVTDELRAQCDVFHHVPDSLEDVCARVLADDLHVLVYLDIGMFPRATQMAGLRLAPVQCTTWGHPVTSGLPTIDWYLSSALMEPDGAQAHYTERLEALPNLGIAYPRPQIPAVLRGRAHFGIDPAATVFLCCQSPFKYLPDHDHVLVEIAARVKSAQFVFVGSHPAQHVLETRLAEAFAGAGLDGGRMLRFVPSQPWPEYLSLLATGDVFLDSLGWSGCNTSLEAMAMGVPVVTCPGRFMRGRHGYAFLTRLGLTGTIANDAAHYVEIAVGLAADEARRQALVRAMQERLDVLYEDRVPVSALEDFYLRTVATS